MATYNPRAGMPPRKKYDVKTDKSPLDMLLEQCWWAAQKDVNANLTKAAAHSEEDVCDCVYCKPVFADYELPPVDANALRNWLLGYMDSIGDQLPDLAQWRRIREEVGRSVAVKEAVKETSVPVKKVEAMERTTGLNQFWPDAAERMKRKQEEEMYEAFVGRPQPKSNLCGND
jgi:hypothetical protein